MNDFFNLLGDFFQNRPLTNEEQILLGILALLIFTLGVIIGWIVQGSKTRRYRKELLLLRKDRDEYEVRYRTTETKQKALAKELEAMSREKVDALDRIQALENELTQRDASLLQLQREKEELSATNQSYAGTIESLNDQVIGLKTQNEQLTTSATATPRGGTTGADAGAGGGSGSNESLNAYILASETRFQQLEQRLATLTTENAELRSVATPANPYTPHQPVMDPNLPTAASTPSSGEPLVIRADTTEPGVRTGSQGDAEVIVQTTPSVHIPIISGSKDAHEDDLTAINNIGPFLQKKLNEADIFTYEQIARWSEADIVTYTGLIGYIPGIIQRDDWVGQARVLAAQPHQKGQETPVETTGETEEDSFQIIEGIGPKIESVLKASGIMTLSQLADTPADRLREILEEAGSRFKSHDPKTWPVQAGLAADGKLEELKAWQGELKGGK